MAEEDEKQMMPYNEMQMAELAESTNRQLNVNIIYVKEQTVVNEHNMTTNIEGSNIEKLNLGQDNPDSKRKTAKLLNAADEGYNPEMVKGENPADITWLSSKVVMFNKRPINCRPTSNSKVYHGRHEIGRGFYRDVAIKLMQYSDSNLREIRFAMKLTHPNIVQIFDVGEYQALGHWIYIVMELCSKNLEDYVTDNHISSEKALLFSRQIVLAVEFMHNRNIAHRDIKPSNILISQCGSFIKITDFGISKEIPFGLTSVTDTSHGAGSEGYKPPELYDPNYKVSLDSDIFSLGLVIVYLLSHGRHPFGDSPFDWGYKIRNNLGFDLSSIPYHIPKRRELIDLLKQMLEHNRLKRPTIRQVAESSFFCENRAEDMPRKSDSIPSVESKSVKHDNVKEFLRRVKIHLRKTVCDCSTLTSQPIKMLLDMQRSRESVVYGNTDSLFGRDVKPIELDQLHDDYNDKPSRHVMILGDSGAGKTTLTKMYSARAAEKKINSFVTTELVHIVSAMFLDGESQSTAFDLLFTQQMLGDVDTELSPEVAKAGERWVKENAEKILIVIDGLDQLAKVIGERNHPKINASAGSSSDHIIANVMSGNIWRGARVLTSSRWDVFWSLKAAQKPDKVIGLRGFDNENMKKAIIRLIIDCGKSETLLHSLQSTPKLLALCRNPLFLSYTLKIFHKNANKMPNSISGLMSAIFFEFIHSTHSGKLELDGLTKLSYQLTLENRFYCSSRHLEELKVNPDKLKGFLSCGTNLPPGHDVTVRDDKTYVFAHETLQEFCCALHIVNLEPPAVCKFIEEKLQESRMEMIRKFLYGVMLDDNNTAILRSYLEDRPCSIKECQDILLRQLLHLIPNKTIDDIKVVHLLSECGADRIHQMKEYVQNIHIDGDDLFPNDQFNLATIIKQATPLNNVFIGGVVFNKSLMQHLKDCPRHAERYQLEWITIVDNTMAVDVYRELPKVIDSSKCHRLRLQNCDLNVEKLITFHDECKRQNIQLTTFQVTDKSMPADAFREFSTALDVTQCKQVVFGNCELTNDKLRKFGSCCSENGLKLKWITIADNAMAVDVYRELSKVIGASKCHELQLENCDLNVEKLITFHDECKKQNIQVEIRESSDVT